MNDAKYIKQKLTELGWEDYGSEFYSKDGIFKADIFGDINGHYTVRIALLCIFDRWANSGVDIQFTSKEKVVDFFETDKYMPAAFSEVTDIIRENISDPRTKEFLYELIDKSAKWFDEV